MKQLIIPEKICDSCPMAVQTAVDYINKRISSGFEPERMHYEKVGEVFEAHVIGTLHDEEILVALPFMNLTGATVKYKEAMIVMFNKLFKGQLKCV